MLRLAQSLQVLVRTTVSSALQAGQTEHSLRINLSNKGKPTLTSTPDVRNPGWGASIKTKDPTPLRKAASKAQSPKNPHNPTPALPHWVVLVLPALPGHSKVLAISDGYCLLQMF